MTMDQVKGAAREDTGHVQDGYGGLIGDVGMQVKGKVNEVGGAAQQLYGKAVNQTEDALSRAQDRASATYGDVEGYLRARPLTAVSIGAGVGLLVGLLIGRGRGR